MSPPPPPPAVRPTDPVYKPILSVKAATSESLTLSWTAPPPEVAPYVQSYQLMLSAGQQGGAIDEVGTERRDQRPVGTNTTPAGRTDRPRAGGTEAGRSETRRRVLTPAR